MMTYHNDEVSYNVAELESVIKYAREALFIIENTETLYTPFLQLADACDFEAARMTPWTFNKMMDILTKAELKYIDVLQVGELLVSIQVVMDLLDA
jgi:hypothetical protein